MPLVINSLGGGHTHTHAYRHSWTEAILRNQAGVCLPYGSHNKFAIITNRGYIDIKVCMYNNHDVHVL